MAQLDLADLKREMNALREFYSRRFDKLTDLLVDDAGLHRIIAEIEAMEARCCSIYRGLNANLYDLLAETPEETVEAEEVEEEEVDHAA
jgi:uncharacterized protein Yka (UPF0111/DUF47 family)